MVVVLWGIQLQKSLPIISILKNHDVFIFPRVDPGSTMLREFVQLPPDLLVCGREVASKLIALAQDQYDTECRAGTGGAIDERKPDGLTSGVCLSQRDAEVLFLVYKGLSNHDIARQLGVSIRTVKGYLTRLFTRFDVTNRTEMVGSAVDLGIEF
ncbi:MAG: helix-turn-helix transcriptional regulator [Bryobacteraceae bacterium]|nr:helix-turn-helix transcriptional regulator [Bryobacterales bacterium]NUN02907.1 helix-turn-helix transcriptional regulator [Bryobacteraceae bacterium]